MGGNRHPLSERTCYSRQQSRSEREEIISADNKTILVSNMVEENVQVFRWDGTALAETGSIKLKGGGAAIRTADRPR